MPKSMNPVASHVNARSVIHRVGDPRPAPRACSERRLQAVQSYAGVSGTVLQFKRGAHHARIFV
jgi:hypothetical protein